MRRKYILFVVLLLIASVVAGLVWYVSNHNLGMLNPKGTIAHQEKNLIIFTTLLGLLVVIPVFIMAGTIAWKYREGNASAKYAPDWDHNRLAEFTWWTIPIIIIVVLSIVTWITSHSLDPYRPLEHSKKPITIQVVALDWKWLFIYPEENIATVNFIQIPKDTPINFVITADAPMNSFWIPQLSGQIYAMPGMSTKLHIEANEEGEYAGSSANISGEGFAGMRFTTKVSSQQDFEQWLKLVKQSSNKLGAETYDKLAKPSKNNPKAYYASVETGLYDTIVMKYMMPHGHEAEHNEGTAHTMPNNLNTVSVP